MFPDGVSVRIADEVCYEPDALVYRGPPLPADALEVPNPIIIVEVLSPSTQHIDIGRKLTGYMTLPSVAHYLIIDPLRPPLVHHQRIAEGTIMTHLVRGGVLRLEPPGIEIDLAPVFANS